METKHKVIIAVAYFLFWATLVGYMLCTWGCQAPPPPCDMLNCDLCWEGYWFREPTGTWRLIYIPCEDEVTEL